MKKAKYRQGAWRSIPNGLRLMADWVEATTGDQGAVEDLIRWAVALDQLSKLLERDHLYKTIKKAQELLKDTPLTIPETR